ncbi:uncharacterized protein TRUGW13939_09719 [Talaromyces rugulosus]|uniref:Major facilitator superfamily (MFS) profile domain-containing protein n=1 Tax=Talaromyces rugulosus TaxID=121627 RepID=A0A7H8R9E3_TALRU|nr:uncharacterized protein TRUGW13939_09719 [Talaromyces rugulosus]QKX62558.1 hypothetical protein TRUGW13939_09719 [Talaromyces rugulosus]
MEDAVVGTPIDRVPLYPGLLSGWNGPEDTENPQNWSVHRRCLITASLCSLNVCYTLSSTTFSTLNTPVAEQYGVSTTAASLATSLFALGAGGGSLLWGPLSERFGRRLPIFVGFSTFLLFHVSSAISTNFATLLVSRFLRGVLGTAPVIVAGGILTDIWDPERRAAAVMTFTMATFMGLVHGPILGASVVAAHITWRWVVWITMIVSGICLCLALTVLRETYQPTILQKRARRIRFRDRDWAVHAILDEQQLSLKEVYRNYLVRPLGLLMRETILLLVSIYLAFVYSLLYVFFEAYPYSFSHVRKWQNMALAALPLLSIALGVCIGGSLVAWDTCKRYNRYVKQYSEQRRVSHPNSLLHNELAEERLPPIIVGGIILSVGLFWFAATSNASVLWLPQATAGIFLGCGIFMIFLPGLNYIIDVYVNCVNSAVAANFSFRCLAAAVAPLVSPPMFRTMGVPWAMATMGFLSIVLVPVPIYFYRWGKKLRTVNLTPPSYRVHPALRTNISLPSVPLELNNVEIEIPPPVWSSIGK